LSSVGESLQVGFVADVLPVQKDLRQRACTRQALEQGGTLGRHRHVELGEIQPPRGQQRLRCRGCCGPQKTSILSSTVDCNAGTFGAAALSV
jgi:hypothetical protein